MLKTYLDSKGGETRNRGVASQSDAARDDKQDILNGKKLIFGKELLEFLDMVGILKQDINAGTILLLVLRLRQCCSHLSLLLQVILVVLIVKYSYAHELFDKFWLVE